MFRKQEEHGGIIRSVIPAEDLVRAGNQAIEAIGKTLLYARVDFVRLESGQPVLMEMELIELSLYLSNAPIPLRRLPLNLIAWLAVEPTERIRIRSIQQLFEIAARMAGCRRCRANTRKVPTA